MDDVFNEFELAVLKWFKGAYTNQQLIAQIDSAKFLKRDWTKVGFYVYFEVSRELEPINLDDLGNTWPGKWPIDGPFLVSEDIHDGGGTLLWGKDGYINCIEMYAHGDFFNETVEKFELYDFASFPLK
jgi:hypothetical protein